MKKIIQLSLLSIVLFLASCSKNDNDTIFEKTVTDDVNYFIWKGMNAYYFWNTQVPDLTNDRFSTFTELYSHFRGYSSPEGSFKSLIYKEDVVDHFSWIVDDYVALENSFQGINLSTGMEFGLKRYNNSSTKIYGYVRYVISNSDASAKSIQRGMLFNTVNGTQLTDSNYKDLLFSSSASLNVGFADYNNGDPISNSTTVTLSKTQIQENPVAISKVINDDVEL